MYNSKERPLVSVITLSYNNFGHIYETILSVLNQDYTNIEYIISDDASREFPCEKISKFINTNNKNNFKCSIIANKKNYGTVKNLNAACRGASGTYIVMLSAGDILFSRDTVSKIVSRFVDTKCDVLATSRLKYRGNFEPICFLPHINNRKYFEEKNQIECGLYKTLILNGFQDALSGSAMSYRKEILKKYNYFDEKYKLWEDGPFIAKYSYDNQIELAYDIVSIFYEAEGISEHGNKNKNPLIQKDILLFNSIERQSHLDIFSRKEQKRIRYFNSLCKVKSKIEKYVLMVLNITLPLKLIMNTMKNKRNIKYDFSVIKNMKINKEHFHISKE